MLNMSCHMCDASFSEEQLYKCNKSRCGNKIFCESCGECSHRKRDHSFSDHMELVTVNQPSNNQYQQEFETKSDMQDNTDKRSYWWNKIEPEQKQKAKKVATFVGGVAAVGCFTVFSPIVVSGMAKLSAVGMVASCVHGIYSKSQEIKRTAADYRQEAILISLRMFSFEENDMNNDKIFNINQIQSRYRKFAKFYHPDKKHGNPAVFSKFDVAKRILLSTINTNEYMFPHDWYVLLQDEDELNAMYSWQKYNNTELKAIEHPISNQNEQDNNITKKT
eukprot:786205_1